MKSQNQNSKQQIHDIDRIEELSAEDATMSEYQTSNNAKEMVLRPNMKSDDEILRLYEKLMGEQPSVPPSVPSQQMNPIVKPPKQQKSEEKLTQPPKLQPKLNSSEKVQPTKKQQVSKPKPAAQRPQLDWYEEEEDINDIIKQTYVPVSAKRGVASIKAIIEEEEPVDGPARQGILTKKDPKNKVDKNRTNYSAEYQQGKPFNTKTPTPQTKKTVSQDKASQPDNISLKGSEKIEKKTAQNFKNKLSQHVVKDKQQVGKPKTKIPPKAQQPDKFDKLAQQKRLRQELMELNYQQTILQAQLRKIHMDNKQRNMSLYKTQNINNTVRSVKELLSEQVLVLDDEEPEQSKKPIALKKLKFLNQDKQYIDDIKLQLRQLNYLLKKKDDSLKQIEQRTKSNPLHYYLYEWKEQPPQIEQEQEKKEQQKITDMKKLEKQLAEQGLTLQDFVKGKQNSLARMIVKNLSKEQNQDNNDNMEFASYKQLMKYRKNKAWMRNQRLNFEPSKPMKESELIQEPQLQKKEPQRIETIEIEEGKLKVNTHLKNLLFN